MASHKTQQRVMIIAGEASGDQHGSQLVNAMKNRDNSVEFYAIGGNALKRAGARIILDSSTLSVVGITEALAKLPLLLRGLDTAKTALRRLRPDLLVLIDFPDFNLNVAAHAKKLGVPVLYYVSPQIWAWRPGRVKKIGKRIDHMAVILPFEETFYRKHDIPVTFVGHPLMDLYPYPFEADVAENAAHGLTLGLLPGSRDKEILTHLPVMLNAASRLKKTSDGLKVIVSLAPSVQKEMVTRMIRAHGLRDDVELCAHPVREVLTRSRLVVAVSGTVTLEAAICGTPMVIIYKVSPLSYRCAKALVRVRYVGLANLIAGREIVPELLQDDATPDIIAHTVRDMLGDTDRLESIRRQMRAVGDRLGKPGAARRVADIAFRMIPCP
jgi:lipid-A-disaccharide synthase